MRDLHIDTLLAQAGHYVDETTGGIVPALQASTTFARDASYQPIGEYGYARERHPLGAHIEELATALEGGAQARVFGSGLAGVAAVFETVESGRHMVAPRIMYHGTREWMRRISVKRAIGLTLFEPSDPDGIEKAIRPGETDLVWIESPINPTWDVLDIAAAADVAHAAGASLAVDGTCAPPVTSRVLEFGADLVFHSATKYFNGHSDVMAGLVVTRETDARWEEIKAVRTLLGGVLGAFEAWLLLRGMRTLAVRFERASENALAIARHFESHPALEAVLYPGLASHPGHELARRQMKNGFGGMLSLLVRGGEDAAKAVANRLDVLVRATSLGGVESLVEHRATVEGPNAEVPRNLLRLSVGIERVDDLVADLDQALAG